MDPGLNQLLKWSIENADVSRDDRTASTDPKAERPSGQPLNAEALNILMGGPSDADLMREAMAAVQSPDISLENKLVAFDNFEQLIENLDNTNNMQTLGLWTPLVALLRSEEGELRRMAAWCVGTAVQNNVQAQERLLVVGAIPNLITLALHDPSEPVRRKAIYALSSEIRNYQPALDVVVQALQPEGLIPTKSIVKASGGVDAHDMEAVDLIVEGLRRRSEEKRSG
ncbi:hsp70 nucleotide exchange factor fes1 [Pseudocyphellaria aurata]|nr:hsp70 nucleotide exchange factor fes1 [Pseudocyphellaria aurata]